MSRAVLMKSQGSFPAIALAKPVIAWSTAMVSSRFSLSCTFFWAFGSMFLILTSKDFILPSCVLIAFGQINTFFNKSSSLVFLTIGCYHSLNFIRLLRVLITPSVTEGVITTRSNRMKFRLMLLLFYNFKTAHPTATKIIHDNLLIIPNFWA